jgi:oligopeptidase B
MHELESEEVKAHIAAEQAHTEAWMEPLASSREALFAELKGRVQEVEQSPGYTKGRYKYYSRTVAGGEYRIYCRRALTPDAPEEIVLDGNVAAQGHDYFSIGALSASPDGRLMAIALDTEGDERYVLSVLDMETGEWLDERIEDASGDVAWSADSRHIWYVALNEQHQPLYVYRHELGTDPERDVLMFEETDPAFFVGLSVSSSLSYILIELEGPNQSEVHWLPADQPHAQPVCVLPRQAERECMFDHHRGAVYMLSNGDGEKDFALYTCEEQAIAEGKWTCLIPHQKGRLLSGCGLYGDYLAVQVCERANERIELMPLDDVAWERATTLPLRHQEEAYSLSLDTATQDPDACVLRYTYESMCTTEEIIDVALETGEQTLRWKREIPDGYDASLYVTRRLYATARDGVSVPMSVLMHRDTPWDGSAPCLLYGYGAYGSSIMPHFSSTYLSLAARGWVCVQAHVRGGQELGYHWYLDGKLENKQHSFTDFLDCAAYLVEQDATSRGRIAAWGQSAGGLLVGAALNMDPGLFGAVLADVPFVDVLTTMLDDEQPLTAGEYNEWGNPGEALDVYERMASYSPYDQVKEASYPPMFVTAGLHDYRVMAWEPMKWVARLRAHQRAEQPILLHMNEAAGHFGQSGRYDYLREPAMKLAFLLRVLGGEK